MTEEPNNTTYRMGILDPLITIIVAAVFCFGVDAQNPSKLIFRKMGKEFFSISIRKIYHEMDNFPLINIFYYTCTETLTHPNDTTSESIDLSSK